MSPIEPGRRDFLKSAALAATASVAVHGSTTAQPPPGGVELPVVSGLKWDKAPCRFCGVGCHVQVGVKNGKVVAITGDRRAEVNKGLLCVKGYYLGQSLYGQDRLTRPLIRRDGQLIPISWDDAITEIATRIEAAPETFAIYGSGQWTIPEGYVANKFIKAGLSNNHIDPNARLCMASAVTGYLSTYGADEPNNAYNDFDECDVLILWGNNLAEMHPILFSRFIDRKRQNDKLILIDLATRLTRSSQPADHTMLFEPQTDLAIANCIAHQLIANGTVNKPFIEKHCHFRADAVPGTFPENIATLTADEYLKSGTLPGKVISFEEYAKLLEPYTPEAVAKLSALTVEQLKLLGSLFGDRSKKILSVWCMGVNQHTMGTAMNNLIHGIHLLSGHFGKPGDGPQSLTGQPSACGTVREVGTLAHALPGGLRVDRPDDVAQAEKLWNLPPGRINPKPGYHTLLMWEKFCSPSDENGAINTLWTQVSNPGQSLPNLDKLFDAKKRFPEKFLIVSDVYPTVTTEMADLILPSAMWVEKNGMYGNSERRTQQWFKMVEPPGDARDDCWQTLAVARKLFDRGHPGMKDQDGKFLFQVTDEAGAEVPVWDWSKYYGTVNVDEKLYEDYRRFSVIKHKHLAPYQELIERRGLRWPVVRGEDGTWRETVYRFVEGSDPFVKEGAGLDFYHSPNRDGTAAVWFRPYVQPPEMPDEEYPLWLDTGRVLEHWHTATMTGRIPQLNRAMPTSYVEMSSSDAIVMGLRTGDTVRLETRRGSLVLPVWVDGRGTCPEGHVFVPFFDAKRLINRLTLDAHCPFSKEPDYKKCAVRVVKV